MPFAHRRQHVHIKNSVDPRPCAPPSTPGSQRVPIIHKVEGLRVRFAWGLFKGFQVPHAVPSYSQRGEQPGRAYGNLGNAYYLQGDSSKAIEYHGDFSEAINKYHKRLAIARWATGRERAGRTCRRFWHSPRALERKKPGRRLLRSITCMLGQCHTKP